MKISLDTSEDTVFVQRLRDAGLKFVYVNNAIVEWRPSTLTLRGAVKTYYQFAVTDGKARLLEKQYGVTFLVYGLTVILMLSQAQAHYMGALYLLGWLIFRIRKVINAALLFQVPLALVTALGMDIARMVGYIRGTIR